MTATHEQPAVHTAVVPLAVMARALGCKPNEVSVPAVEKPASSLPAPDGPATLTTPAGPVTGSVWLGTGR